MTETTGPGGTVRDGYDTAGQLHSIDIDGSFGGGSAYWCGPAGLEFGCLPGTMTGVTYPGFISVTYSYDAYGEMDTVAYGETTGGTLFAGDRVTYSPGGRKLTDESVPGLFHTYTNPNPTGGTDFSYDGAGRLIQAYEPGKVIDYSYANSSPTEDCPVPDAGENTDLTSVTTYPSSGGTATTRYCYDGADQITKTATSGTATTAKSGTSTTYAFDAEGFQTQNKGTSYTWTASGQMASATSGDTMVTYTYDALDRLIARTKGTTTTRYAYCGFTTSPCAVLSATGAVDQQVVSGIGGVLVTVKPGNNSPTYSFANLAGNYIFSKRLYGTWSPTVTYSPYGAVSTRTGASHNGLSGGLSEGAFGTAGKLTDRTLTTTLVFMGARVYSPTEGRFLSVDPIEGGCANAYVYVRGDPVNSSDLDGQGTCIPEFTGSFPVTASTGGTRSVCGYTASVKSTGRTSVVEIGSANPVETAQQCFTNLGTENMQCSTVEGGSGPAAVCHGTGTLGTGTYTYRSHGSKTTYPVINVHVGSSTLTIHFTYVASSPCRGPTQDA